MNKFDVYLTSKDAKDGLKCGKLENFIIKQNTNIKNRVKINTNKEYQKIRGFVRVLTEASVYALSKIDEDERKNISINLKAYSIDTIIHDL